jgi:hypothetical protein
MRFDRFAEWRKLDSRSAGGQGMSEFAVAATRKVKTMT